jgi:hypothetical protein
MRPTTFASEQANKIKSHTKLKDRKQNENREDQIKDCLSVPRLSGALGQPLLNNTWASHS